jgi:hypothetical protein
MSDGYKDCVIRIKAQLPRSEQEFDDALAGLEFVRRLSIPGSSDIAYDCIEAALKWGKGEADADENFGLERIKQFAALGRLERERLAQWYAPDTCGSETTPLT